MLILFDQGTPVGIRNALAGHSIRTAHEQGWSTLLNGELLQVAEEAGFDVLLTTDKNLAFPKKDANERARTIRYLSPESAWNSASVM